MSSTTLRRRHAVRLAPVGAEKGEDEAHDKHSHEAWLRFIPSHHFMHQRCEVDAMLWWRAWISECGCQARTSSARLLQYTPRPELDRRATGGGGRSKPEL